MDLSNPLRIVTPTLDASVLQVLTATTGWTTGGEVHRRSGRGSRDGVRRVLLRLVDQGIVLAQEERYATLFLLNRDHVGADAIIALTRLRQEIVTRIQSAIAAWPRAPLNASLFGSFARGEAGAQSDIDVLVVGPVDVVTHEGEWADQIDSLRLSIESWTGNSAHIVTPSRQVLREMVAAEDPLVGSLRADHIHLCGSNLLELLRHAS